MKRKQVFLFYHGEYKSRPISIKIKQQQHPQLTQNKIFMFYFYRGKEIQYVLENKQ